ncbi:MAG: IS200/IS605 family transposase [Planctomycetota bacterium]
MSYTNLTYHVVFSTKQRRPILTADVSERVFEYLGGIVRKLDAKLLRAGGADDHVHLALSGPATLSVAELVRKIKANTSRWMHQKLPDQRNFAWQDGYAAFSVSASALDRVLDYIASQREHHRRMTFEEELKALLDKRGIEYDERYICA